MASTALTAGIPAATPAARAARSAHTLVQGKSFLRGASAIPVARSPANLFASSRKLAVQVVAEDDDAAFEERLNAIKKATGKGARGEGKKAEKRVAKKDGAVAAAKKKEVYDFTNEKVHFEGSPSNGDVATNMALGITLVWLPLTMASIARRASLKYVITDKRVSIIRNAPWEEETRVDVAYPEITDVIVVGRGIGFWGDMVITLRDGSKVELRSIEKFQELRDYIRERVSETKAAVVPAGGGGFTTTD